MNYQEPSQTPRKPSHPVWRAIKIAVGLGFLVLGFIGLFLPILQGVLFMLLGLAILGTESPRVRRLLEKIKKKHPGPWKQAQAIKKRMQGWKDAWSGRSEEGDT
jgi:uncharacterized membrane protein YbaN (DUF454 family)